MSLEDELREMGYRFECEYIEVGKTTEVWIHPVTGRGVTIEWDRLVEVEA